MSRFARRKINALQRAAGSGVEMTQSKEFGMFMQTYDGIPIYCSDWVKDNYPNNASSVLSIASYDFDKTRTTDYDNTVIFAMKLGPRSVMGLNAGNLAHERSEFHPDYDAVVNRFKWYCGLACFSKYHLACLTGIEPSS